VRVRPHPPLVAADAETPAPPKPDGQ
jgi:hypothetical protein